MFSFGNKSGPDFTVESLKIQTLVQSYGALLEWNGGHYFRQHCQTIAWVNVLLK